MKKFILFNLIMIFDFETKRKRRKEKREEEKILLVNYIYMKNAAINSKDVVKIRYRFISIIYFLHTNYKHVFQILYIYTEFYYTFKPLILMIYHFIYFHLLVKTTTLILISFHL